MRGVDDIEQCLHAIMAARARRDDPYSLFSAVFTLSTYRHTY